MTIGKTRMKMYLNSMSIGLVIWCLLCTVDGSVRPTAIRLQNNGYSGILLAIHPSVPQDQYLIDDIKDMFVGGSEYLHEATDKRAFFQEVTILVPNTWSSNPAWSPATSQLYHNADIIMRDPFKATKRSSDTPHTHSQAYTRSFGGCGQPGVRINLFTDMFGSRGRNKFGPSGRVLVHEWAHYRWGVFDEYSQEGEPQFYFSPTSGKLEAVRCNIHMVGRIYKTDPATGRAQLCQKVNPQTGVYEEGCLFNPYTRGHFNDNITASIMDRQQVPTITQFCNDDQLNGNRMHNYESPSRHNRLCGSRSTWAVISESEDFKGGKNSPRQVSDTKPKINIVRSANNRQVVLAVDSSGSMENNGNLKKARQAATTLLEDGLDDQTAAGVVSFAATAKIAVPLKKMDSPGVRSDATKGLPLEGCEGTNLALGIIKSLELVNKTEMNSSDTFIVILTDGENTASDDFNLALREVKKSNVVVSVVAFSNEVDQSLIEAASITGGRFYFDNNLEESTSAMDAVLDIFSYMDAGTKTNPVHIMSRAKSLNDKNDMEGKFLLDETLGRETRIIVTYTDAEPNLEVRSPTGRIYSSLYPEYSHNPEEKRMRIDVPLLAETGDWTYSLTSYDHDYSTVSIVVLSKGRSPDVEPIRMTGAIWLLNNSWPLRSQISAEVLREGHPVRGIKVKAVIERPYTFHMELELHDSGAGADAVKGDGVYSRFFNRFSTKGYYGVRLEAFNDKGGVHAVMVTAHAGCLFVDHPMLPSKRQFFINMRERTKKDDLPPAKITDLRILNTNHANNTVVLSWTAPGDDDDFDKAFSYTIAFSNTVSDMIHEHNLVLLDPSAVIKGDLNSPRHVGETEEMKIKLDVLPATNISLVFAVHALDESGNKGEISNIVTAGFGFVPDFSSKDYLEEEDHEGNGEIVETPHRQKILIAAILGVFSGILIMATLMATVICTHFYFRKKSEVLKKTELVGKVV